jgi:hypothetical protein
MRARLSMSNHCRPHCWRLIWIPTRALDLSWQDNASSEASYHVERSVDGGGWAEIAVLGANVETYTDTNTAACDTDYAYRVRAYDSVLGRYSYRINNLGVSKLNRKRDAILTEM